MGDDLLLSVVLLGPVGSSGLLVALAVVVDGVAGLATVTGSVVFKTPQTTLSTVWDSAVSTTLTEWLLAGWTTGTWRALSTCLTLLTLSFTD